MDENKSTERARMKTKAIELGIVSESEAEKRIKPKGTMTEEDERVRGYGRRRVKNEITWTHEACVLVTASFVGDLSSTG